LRPYSLTFVLTPLGIYRTFTQQHRQYIRWRSRSVSVCGSVWQLGASRRCEVVRELLSVKEFPVSEVCFCVNEKNFVRRLSLFSSSFVRHRRSSTSTVFVVRQHRHRSSSTVFVARHHRHRCSSTSLLSIVYTRQHRSSTQSAYVCCHGLPLPAICPDQFWFYYFVGQEPSRCK